MSSSLQSKKILIIDQSKSFLALAQENCQKHQLTTFCVSELVDVNPTIQQHNPHMILMNCSYALEDESGFYQIVSQIKTTHLTPILAYSDLSDGPIFLKLSSLGVDIISSQAFITQHLIAMLELLSKRIGDPIGHLGYLIKMVGMHKHELNNLLSILYGKQMKLERTHPEISSDPAFISIKETLARIESVTKRMNEIRQLPELIEQDVAKADIKKAG